MYEGVLSKSELPPKKTIGMWDGEAWNMGLRDRFELLAVRKILGKQQLSILPVRYFLIFHFIAHTSFNVVGELLCTELCVPV